MVEISDEDAKKIGEAVRLSRISNIWKDPKKTENIVSWLVIGLAVSLMINIMVFAIISDPGFGFGGNDRDSLSLALDHLTCKDLSKLLLEVQDQSYSVRGLVSTYQQAKCM